MTMSKSEKCQDMINSLLEYSCRSEFAAQMEIARELFAVATGKVTDEDPFYENRLSVFQHFFIFDFRLSEVFSGSTIFELFLLRLHADSARKSDVLDYEHFRSMRRSLFRVEKFIDKDTVVARDIFARTALTVRALPEYTFSGFEGNNVFEARVFTFRGENFFAGAFVFHPHEVSGIIEKRIRDFLVARTFQPTDGATDWRAELKHRHEILAALAEQKRLVGAADKRKAIEVLTVNKSLAKLSQEMGGSSLVMALGNREEVSAFVPETPFYDAGALMDALSYSELKCCRFRHINPQKLYSPDNGELSAPALARSAPLSSPHPKGA